MTPDVGREKEIEHCKDKRWDERKTNKKSITQPKVGQTTVSSCVQLLCYCEKGPTNNSKYFSPNNVCAVLKGLEREPPAHVRTRTTEAL